MPKDENVLHALGEIQGTLAAHTDVLKDVKRHVEKINGEVDVHAKSITKHSVEIETLQASRKWIRTLASGAAIVAVGTMLRSMFLGK